MERRTFNVRVQWIAVAVAALLTSACSLDKQEEPALMGPSDLGLSIALTATPDQLPRDGSSSAVVTLIARDPSNRPIVGQRLLLSLGTGSPVGAALSQQEVTTNAQGTATFSVSAPSQGSTGNSIVIVATPVGNNADNTRARILSISVNPPNVGAPTAAFTFSPATPEIGQVVTFDASTTTDEGVACNTCTFIWNFGGDGTATGRVATHVFGAAGPYSVTLTAVDSVGTSSQPVSQTVTVTAATIPTITSVTSSPNPPLAKQAATFTATATAAQNHRIVTYEFAWGDGSSNNTSNSNVIQHAYSQSGNVLLTLTVRDDLNQSSTRNFVIAVSSGLTASFTFSPANPTNNQTVTFDASNSSSSQASTITDYAWDFESDGTYDTNGTSAVATHAYSTGTYRATLRITDSRGVTQTSTQTITVQ
jgi:PKD repeat protein